MAIKPEDLKRMREDCGLPHLPTPLTYAYRQAISGEGPLAGEWADKPHRLVFDLCRAIEQVEAQQK